jgi:nucleoside-diphosphate-sugar epimerase
VKADKNSFDSETFKQLSGKKVLVTGAGGFIGEHLCERLNIIGAEVYGTSRFEKVANDRNIKWLHGSLDDNNTAEKIIKTIKPHLIFHLAGDVTASNELKHVLSTYSSLLTSTVNILTFAAETGCEKIILTGSSTEPLDNNPSPNSPYAAAKWATIAYGTLFQKIYKLPVVLLRPFMGYGPGQPSGKLIPHVILTLLKGQKPKLTSGLWKVDWIYIDDMVDGILAATVAAKTEMKPLDLGSGTLISIRETVEKLVEIVNPNLQPDFGAIPDRFSEHSRIADVNETYSQINWRSKVSFEEGLQKTVDWFKQSLNTSNPKDIHI